MIIEAVLREVVHLDYNFFTAFDNGVRVSSPVKWKERTPQSSRIPHVPHVHPAEKPGDKLSELNDPTEKKHLNSHQVDAYTHFDHGQTQRHKAVFASDIMASPVFGIPPDTSLNDAWTIFNQKRFRHVPIVEGHRLLGILSDRDILNHTLNFTLGASSQEPKIVSDIMTKQVITCIPQTPIREVADMLFTHQIGAMLIVDPSEKLLGILTRSDILRTLINKGPLELWV